MRSTISPALSFESIGCFFFLLQEITYWVNLFIFDYSFESIEEFFLKRQMTLTVIVLFKQFFCALFAVIFPMNHQFMNHGFLHGAKYFFIKKWELFIFFSDGEYEHSMSICPPPLTMIIFSIVEIIMFFVDIIYLRWGIIEDFPFLLRFLAM